MDGNLHLTQRRGPCSVDGSESPKLPPWPCVLITCQGHRTALLPKEPILPHSPTFSKGPSTHTDIVACLPFTEIFRDPPSVDLLCPLLTPASPLPPWASVFSPFPVCYGSGFPRRLSCASNRFLPFFLLPSSIVQAERTMTLRVSISPFPHQICNHQV